METSTTRTMNTDTSKFRRRNNVAQDQSTMGFDTNTWKNASENTMLRRQNVQASKTYRGLSQ